MANNGVILVLVGMMLLTGCCNTLLTKYQDMQCVRNCDQPDIMLHRTFEQPVIQTLQMFVGETGCWIVVLGFWLHKTFVGRKDAPLLYHAVGQNDEDDDQEENGLLDRTSSQNNAHPIAKAMVAKTEDDRIPLEGWKVVLLAIPGCCDITATTLMNIGLLFVAASIYQMTRGALVLFVGLFSVIFLKRKLFLYHWFSLFIVVIGVALVGLAGALFSGDKNPHTAPEDKVDLLRAMSYVARDVVLKVAEPAVLHTILGIFLIAFAQIFTATQFCLEEWILEKYALEPLKVVAWEGLFGLIVTALGQLILHVTIGTSTRGRFGYFDAQEGYREIFTNRAIAISSIAIMISIGGFNFFGLSVTRTISATSRSIIDTCRTLFIWIVSLALGWESFKWLQVVGFALLVYGTFMFNDLVRPPIRACMPSRHDLEIRPEMLPEESIVHS